MIAKLTRLVAFGAALAIPALGYGQSAEPIASARPLGAWCVARRFCAWHANLSLTTHACGDCERGSCHQ